MSFGYVSGDLTELIKSDKYQNFVHGCNCMNTMGAGVAKIIKTQFPDAYRVDQATVVGDKHKLGDYTSCYVDVGEGNSVNIINAYTQYRYGRDKCHLNYNALVRVMNKIALDCKGQSVLMVKIGGGLAGGDWPLIAKMIEHILGDTCDVSIINY